MIEHYETAAVFDYIPNVLRLDELQSFSVSNIQLIQTKQLMAPEEVFNQEVFGQPEVITLEKYPTFDDLVKSRDKIQRLQLLPVKTDEEQIWYHEQPKDRLLKRIYDNLGTSPIALAVNLYPYCLPEDLGQYLVWIKNRDYQNPKVEDFITRCMRALNLGPNELILFERPMNITTKIVKGTFSELRHIHFWIKLKA